ncbi:14217_t:CDS:1, partial [Entrophospora sp. SA101]
MSQNINYCQVLDCESNKDIRIFTPGAKKKSEEKETLSMYNYLNI